ncbi:MAG: hypothetical protein N2114_05250 [Candidatus Goldbacteria bacterium]|nr:hypothetical protein [Candidatus Goldiibacteriota bacterium]
MKLQEILDKRKLLQELSDISFRYNVVNRKYPLTIIRENQYDELLRLYDEQLKEVISLAEKIKEYENNRKPNKSNSAT